MPRAGHEVHLAAPQTQCRVEVVVTEEFGEALDPPGERHDGLDPELAVDLGLPRVVQPSHHSRYTEDLACQTRDDDIGVIAPRNGGQAVHTLDASLEEHLTVQGSPKHRLPREPRAKALQGGGLLIHDGHRLATLTEALG